MSIEQLPIGTAAFTLSASNTSYSNSAVLTGSNAATIKSTTGQAFVVDVPTQTVQTQSMVNAISASDATFSGTVRVTGAGNITAGTDASGVVVSGSQSAQTQSNIQAIAASDTTYATGTVVMTGSNAATIKSAAGQKVVIDVPTQTVQPVGSLDLAGNTAGTMATLPLASNVELAGGNNITLSQASGASSSRVTISGPNTAAQSVQPGVQNLVASDNTFSSGTVTVTGAGEGITVNTAASKIQISGAQTGVKHLVASDNTFSSGTASITGAGEGITVNTAASKIQISGAQTGVKHLVASDNTFSSGTVSITGTGGGVTVNTAASKIQVSVAAQSVQPVGSLSLSGNTAGTMANLPFASNIVLSAAGGATLSQSSGASSSIVQLSVHTSQSVQPGIQNLIASDNTFSSGTVTVTGAGEGITVNTAASKIQISGAQTGVKHLVASDNTFSSGTMSVTGAGEGITVNTAASKLQISGAQTGVKHLVASDNTFSSGTVSITGSNNITVNTAASKIQISAPNTSAQSVQTQSVNPKMAFWQIREDAGLVALSHLSAISKTPIYFPVSIPGDMTLNSIGVRLGSVGTATLQSFSIHFGLYTLVNSTSAALLGSASDSYNDSVSLSASWSAARDWVLTSPSTQTAISNITAGPYVMGLMFSAAASQSINLSLVGAATNATSVAEQGMVLPGANSFSTGTSQGLNGFYGQGSSTVNAMPANVSAPDIRNQGTATQPLIPYVFIRS